MRASKLRKIQKKSINKNMIRCTWSRLLALTVIFGMALWSSSCTRAASDMSTVSLQLPSYSNSQNVNSSGVFSSSSAFSCNPCLKSITVHVDGDEFKTISFRQIHSDASVVGSQLDTSISLEVPGGNNRRIQILALYMGELTGGIRNPSIQYASTTVNLQSAEPPPIELKLTKLGNFVSSAIAGRILTAADAGPTGEVDVIYTHPASGLELLLPSSQIVNGWFRFPASENFELSYVLNSTQTTLLSKVTSSQLKSTSASKHLVHFTRPKIFYYDSGNPTTYSATDAGDIVYGYFSSNPALLADKKVCVQNNTPDYTASSFASMYLEANPSSGSNRLLLYHHQSTASGTAPDIFATGGDTAINCGSVENNISYTANQISIVKDQFHLKGNDTAVALHGLFTSFNTAGVIGRIKVEGTYSAPIYRLQGLPNVFVPTGNNLYGKNSLDGIRVFKTSSAGSLDDIRCHEKWLDSRGFSESALTSLNIDPLGSITFSVNLASEVIEANNAYIVCPSSNGNLSGFAGMKLGRLFRPQLGELLAHQGGVQVSTLMTPNTYPAESTPISFKLKNIGASEVKNIVISPTLSAGGSLSLSSTNCGGGIMLNSAQECDVDLLFTSAIAGTFNGTVTVTYDRTGSTASTLVLPFTATVSPPLLVASTLNANITATQVGQSITENLQIAVNGNGAENIQLSIIGANANLFTILSNGGLQSSPLAMGNYLVAIEYTPLSVGSHTATLLISYTSEGIPRAPISITINATGAP